LPAIAVGKGGNVYVAFVESAGGWDSREWKIMLDVSRDGGATFAEPLPVARTSRVMMGIPSFPRAWWIPTIAVTSEERLLVAWADGDEGAIDVFCAASDDEGTTWTHPVRVSESGRDQALQYLAVDAIDGSAYVAWYDASVTMTLARSSDGGRTFTRYAFGEAATDPTLASFGDYIGMAAHGGVVYAAWPEYVAGEAPPEASPEHDLGGGFVLEAGQWPFGPAAIKVGIVEFSGS
jgi:hypothetical protein